MSTHVHPIHHGHVATAWRHWLVELIVLALAITGFYFGITNFIKGDVDLGLMVLGWFLGPAIIYAFGYLWCLPDTLHEIHLDESRTMHQRWSDFVLLASFIATLVIVGTYFRAIWANYSYVSLPVAVALVIVGCWLLAACAVASEKYLSWNMPDADARTLSGWRPRVR